METARDRSTVRRFARPARAGEERTAPRDPPPALLVLGSGRRAAAAAAAALIAGGLVNATLWDNSVGQLNPDAEGTVWTWVSSTAAAIAAFAALLLALLGSHGRRSRLLLAAVLAYFSLDDALVVHERIGVELDVGDAARVVWPVVYLPLLAMAFVLLRSVGRAAHPEAARVVRVGLACLAAAVVTEMSSFVMLEAGARRGGNGDILEIILEESLELGGWLLIATGLTAEVLDRVAGRASVWSARAPGTE